MRLRFHCHSYGLLISPVQDLFRLLTSPVLVPVLAWMLEQSSLGFLT